MTRQIALHSNLCTITNPTSNTPPYWPNLDDTEEGRRELGRRIALVARLEGEVGNDALHLVLCWAEMEGIAYAG